MVNTAVLPLLPDPRQWVRVTNTDATPSATQNDCTLCGDALALGLHQGSGPVLALGNPGVDVAVLSWICLSSRRASTDLQRAGVQTPAVPETGSDDPDLLELTVQKNACAELGEGSAASRWNSVSGEGRSAQVHTHG